MKIALLGIDAHLLALADAVARDSRHEIAVVCDADEAATELLNAHPTAVRENQWESLLLARGFDLLVVGTARASSEVRVEQLRRFVQEAVPLVVVQPAAEAIVLHELAMIQHDTRSLLAAWNPVLSHPAVPHVREFCERSRLAEQPIRQVSVQRNITEPTWPAIQTQLARDGQWVRELIGPPDRVTALAPASESGELSSLAVTFVGPTEALAQWTLGSGDDVTKIASGHGEATLLYHRTPCGDVTSRSEVVHSLTIESTAGREEMSWSEAEIQQAMGRDFLAFLQTSSENQAENTTFDHGCRAVELAEAAHESNRRSRTIHLHYEEHSEQQTFKSVMAAGGCLILLGVLFVLGISIVIDSIGAPVRNNPWWRIWPAYLLVPVVAFVLLQVLWRVFATDEKQSH